MQKIIITILIVAAAVAVIVFTKNTPTPDNPNNVIPDRNTTDENVVTYTDSGYSPKDITVKSGTAVKFVNDSKINLMWIASDPHPTHTMMHQFDSLKGLPGGQSYSFTFSQSGMWRFHNHLVPGHMGSVIVE
ncbi:MAG: cupredoxin domain-containing protein [bacterium]|nr:cupredoxin domain-containing protein [bacterium]